MQTLIRTLALGLVSGSVYALAATGLVLTYKTSGVLNFGYGAFAVFTSFVFWQMSVAWSWPVWLAAAVVVLVVAPLIGFALDAMLFRRLDGQPPVIAVIATVGMFVLLQGIVVLIWGGRTHSVPSLFPPGTVRLPGGAHVATSQLGILATAAVSTAALAAVLRFTPAGIAFRAVVENRALAGLTGVNTSFVSGCAWALGSSFAALTGILLSRQFLLDPNFLPPFIIAFVVGAAAVGHLRSLPVAYAGGLAIGVAQTLAIQYAPSPEHLVARLADALPFLVTAGAVLLAPRALRFAGLDARFMVRVREPVPAAPPVVAMRVAAALFGFLTVLPLVTRTSPSWTIALATGMGYAIVFLSLVMLTGYSGQISLGHTAFMGIAAFAAAHAVQDLGWPALLALPVGALAAALAGGALGVLAVRLHGLFLALLTLAFAFMAQSLLFAEPAVSGGEGGIALPRPAWLRSATGFYYLALVALAACALLAHRLSRNRTGRVLAAMRDSEIACRALGIPVARYKALIFAVSAAVAGIGSVVTGMILETVSSRSFLPFYSLVYVTLAVVGGIFHIGGALCAGLLFSIVPRLAAPGEVEILGRLHLILFGLGATLALAHNPEGVFGELRRVAARLRRADRSAARALPATGGHR